MQNLSNVLQASRQHAKSANDGFYNAVQAVASAKLQQQALHDAISTGLLGAGVGAGVRGAAGLYQLINRNMTTPKPTLPPSVGIPVEEEAPLEKDSMDVSTPVSEFIRGDGAQTVSGIPWAMPAIVGSGALGLYGGWRGMDYLMDKQRKSELDDELEKTKAEYETALQASFKKHSEFSEVAEALDELYDAFTKQATSAAYSEKQSGGADADGVAARSIYNLWGALGLKPVQEPLWENGEGLPQVDAFIPDFLGEVWGGRGNTNGMRQALWAERPIDSASARMNAAGLLPKSPPPGSLLPMHRPNMQPTLKPPAGPWPEALRTKKQSSAGSDLAGKVLGGYGLFAGASGLAAAAAAYEYGRKRQRRSIVDRALKERRRKRFAAQPAALYAEPVPMKSVPSSMQTAPPQEELLLEG